MNPDLGGVVLPEELAAEPEDVGVGGVHLVHQVDHYRPSCLVLKHTL